MPLIIGWNTTKPLNTSTAASSTKPPILHCNREEKETITNDEKVMQSKPQIQLIEPVWRRNFFSNTYPLMNKALNTGTQPLFNTLHV